MFEDRHLSSYLADPVGLKAGYKDAKKAMFESRRLKTLEVAELRANKEVIKWESKALETETFESIKASFIAEMLRFSLVSVAFKDKDYRKPTSAATRYWKSFNYKSLPNAEKDIDVDDIYFYGPPGSLAFYSLSLNSKLILKDPLDYIRLLLIDFWNRLNISFSLSPRERFEAVMKKVNFDKEYLTAAEDQAQLMLLAGNFVFNRRAITKDNINNLPLKLLLGELDDCIVSELDALAYYLRMNSNHNSQYNLVSVTDNPILSCLTKLVRLAPPAGFSIILQAFSVESLYRICNLLNKSKIDPLTAKKDFFLNDSFKELRIEVAKHLCLSIDALNGLSMFSTIESSEQTKNKLKSLLLYFLSSTEETTVEIGGSTRLPLFEQAITTNRYSDILLVAGSSLDIPIKQPTTNSTGDLLSVNANKYIVWGRLELNLNYLSASKKVRAINVWIIPLTESVSFQPVKTTLLTNQSKRISLPLTGMGYGGLIAVVNNLDSAPVLEEIDLQTVQSNTLIFENNVNV